MAKSLLGTLIPLVILLIVLGVVVAIGIVVYQVANEVANKTQKRMEKHNVSFGPDGMKVGVKSKTAEEVGDRTQSVIMKVWNSSSWPAYKSKLGWGQGAQADGEPTKRQPYSRTTSQASNKNN